MKGESAYGRSRKSGFGIGTSINFKDITGKRYSRLTVLERQRPVPGANNTRWVCICDCGNETVAYGFQLKAGNAKSCGCLRGKNAKPWLAKYKFPYTGAERRAATNVPT